MNTRRDFLRTVALVGTAVGPTWLPRAIGKPRRRPNIVFILADDLSYIDLGCYGQRWIETPNLDRLYRESMRFTHAYAGAAECAPSRCSLMTGLHMGHARVRLNASVRGQDHLLDQDITVAEVLKEGGYRTALTGKWGIGTPGTAGVPYKQGFDLAFGYFDQLRAHGYYPEFLDKNDQRLELPQNDGYDMERTYCHTRDDSAHVYDEQGNFIPPGVPDSKKATYSETLIRAEALKFIRESKDQPFFLYYATQLPHGPLVTPNLRQYKDRPYPSLKHKEWAAMVTHLDESVGQIAGLIRDLGLDNDTVIFFAGDNGYSEWGYFNRPRHSDDPFFHNKGPWRGGKFESREGGVRVPLFVRWPGHIKPGETDFVCAFWDFLPTVAELAGVKPPKTDGLSLLPLLTGHPGKQPRHDYLYWETSHEQAARMDRFHAFRQHPSKPTEVYDVIGDPGCTKDLAPQRPDLVARFERIFKEARTDSQWYINPGETPEQIEAKREKARKAGQMIQSQWSNRIRQ